MALAVLAGNEHTLRVADPIATVYAGHQFGGYNPQLGDGRAILLGEVIGPGRHPLRHPAQGLGANPLLPRRRRAGRRWGAVLREYIVSEAMHSLGVATTRALAAVTTGDQVTREMFLPGAVLARVAQSHIRIGTFQFFAARQDKEALNLLVEHVLARHYPADLAADNPALALLLRVVRHRPA